MDSRRSAHPVGSTDCARRTPARISMLFFLLGTFAGIFLLASQGFAEAHSSRSKHYSHRSRFSGPRAPRAPDPPEPSPFFDNGTSRNVTTSAGKAVFLPCKVRHLGDRTVSWIRRRDLHVLTVGRFTYTSDQRFQTIHMENSDSWMLQIQYPQKKDAGVYECQVSTLPKISRFVTLNVIVSKASIPGGPTLYLNSGSTLNLTCEIMESPMAPDFVFWYHNGRVINYEINNRGISIHTEKLPKTLSRLLISNAQPQDSGNYSCVPSNAEPADITVHVLNGEQPAAFWSHGPVTPSHDDDGDQYDVAEPHGLNSSNLGVKSVRNATGRHADSVPGGEVVAKHENGFVGDRNSSGTSSSQVATSNPRNVTVNVLNTPPLSDSFPLAEDKYHDLIEASGGNSSEKGVSGERLGGNDTGLVHIGAHGTGTDGFIELSNDTIGVQRNTTAESAEDMHEEENATPVISNINQTVDSEFGGIAVPNNTFRAWMVNTLKENGINLSTIESHTKGPSSNLGNDWDLGDGGKESISGRQRFSQLCSNVTDARVDALCSHVAILTDFVSTLTGALRDVLLVLKACMSD
ncbi:uncharacterized protein LOC8043300 isoform X1 [Ixodes scapularis]|uniref:uncharacterized protein LOC8043300 isoform X1 n=1 Tax=Ixodes scapularis TaxID=6945 RepID=UPI001A9DF7C4|nr:uncharacterized protein LOC8043300 isoform X1 [Ixodes scapularis]